MVSAHIAAELPLMAFPTQQGDELQLQQTSDGTPLHMMGSHVAAESPLNGVTHPTWVNVLHLVVLRGLLDLWPIVGVQALGALNTPACKGAQPSPAQHSTFRPSTRQGGTKRYCHGLLGCSRADCRVC